MVRRFVSRLSAPAAHRLAAVMAMLCIITGSAAAQASSIAGKITDAQSGTPIVGARVTAVSGLRTAATVVTGDDGTFRITGLTAGVYVVSST